MKLPTKLITLRRAKTEVKKLQAYIDLVEGYQTETLEKQIIKEYALNNSIAEVVREFERRGIKHNSEAVDYEYVRSIIKGTASDELHRKLKSGYLQKIKPSKRG